MTNEHLANPTAAVDAEGRQLTPYGLLVLKLRNHEWAQATCNVLERHMRKFNLALCVDGDGLVFDEDPVNQHREE